MPDFKGFSLIELVTVLLIVSVLGVFVVPRFMDSAGVNQRTAQDILVSAARQAQQLAMTKGSAAAVTFTADNGNKRARIQYTEGTAQTIDFGYPDGISTNTISISYNAKGDALIANNISINIIGTNRNVCISTTGYAYAC